MPRFVLLLSFVAAGCKSTDCPNIAGDDDRDWCYYDRVVAGAAQADLDGALESLQRIQSPMVRAFATARLITAEPPGLTVQHAENLCNQLVDPHKDSCIKSWSRPHLWNR